MDLGDGVVLIPVEIPAEQCIHGESPLSHRVTQTLSSLDGEHPHLPAAIAASSRPLKGRAVIGDRPDGRAR